METINLKASTLMPEPNCSYLAHTKDVPNVSLGMDNGTLGLMMLLSTFQWQAPYMSPIYSDAARQVGHAAFIQSGGQAAQDKLKSSAAGAAKDAYRSAGISDTEVGTVFGTAKVLRDRQVQFNGPMLYFFKTHLTVGQDHSGIDFGVNF